MPLFFCSESGLLLHIKSQGLSGNSLGIHLPPLVSHKVSSRVPNKALVERPLPRERTRKASFRKPQSSVSRQRDPQNMSKALHWVIFFCKGKRKNEPRTT